MSCFQANLKNVNLTLGKSAHLSFCHIIYWQFNPQVHKPSDYTIPFYQCNVNFFTIVAYIFKFSMKIQILPNSLDPS